MPAGALTGAATSASAQTTEVRMDYTCTSSLGSSARMTVWVVGGLPDEGAGPNTVAKHEPAYLDLRPVLTMDGGVRLDTDSTATRDAHVTGPDGTRTTWASFTVAPTWLTTTQGAAVRAAGSFPVQFLTTPGYYDLHVDDLALTLCPERADGTPLGTVTASCSHDPAQNDLLGTVWSQPDRAAAAPERAAGGLDDPDVRDAGLGGLVLVELDAGLPGHPLDHEPRPDLHHPAGPTP